MEKCSSTGIVGLWTTRCFPNDEKFALVNQIRRCAVSITSNIAEGFGRNSSKDKVQFYAIARGSLLGLESQLLISKDLGYLKEINFNDLNTRLILVGKMLAGLIKSAKSLLGALVFIQSTIY